MRLRSWLISVKTLKNNLHYILRCFIPSSFVCDTAEYYCKFTLRKYCFVVLRLWTSCFFFVCFPVIKSSRHVIIIFTGLPSMPHNVQLANVSKLRAKDAILGTQYSNTTMFAAQHANISYWSGNWHDIRVVQRPESLPDPAKQLERTVIGHICRLVGNMKPWVDYWMRPFHSPIQSSP